MDFQELKRDIPAGLSDAVNRQLVPGESIVILLPGSVGEALAVTDRRAIVTRERPTGLDVVSDVYTYPLTSVTGASIVPSSAGGFIELKFDDPVSDPETARVYYPLEEGPRFAAAAEYLQAQHNSSPVPAPTAKWQISKVGSAGKGSTCTRCGSDVADDAAFCGHCGAALQLFCQSCGSPSPAGSRFCSRCGKDFVEYTPECAKCGARILRSMLYCPECGAMQRPICMGCGSPITAGWRYCAFCGRKFDSNLEPCEMPMARRRIQGLQERQAERMPGPVPEAQPITQPTGVSGFERSGNPETAEEHNRRGTELFETEDFAGAVKEYAIASSMEPENGTYHCNLGMAYDESGLDDLALKEYERALELDPNDLTALMSLGYLYSESDRFDDAQRVWGRVLEIAPDSAEAQEVRQNLHHQDEL